MGLVANQCPDQCWVSRDENLLSGFWDWGWRCPGMGICGCCLGLVWVCRDGYSTFLSENGGAAGDEHPWMLDWVAVTLITLQSHLGMKVTGRRAPIGAAWCGLGSARSCAPRCLLGLFWGSEVLEGKSTHGCCIRLGWVQQRQAPQSPVSGWRCWRE